jgi:mRNA deadenylase 3'-5' endonuclease subunit Ccr4
MIGVSTRIITTVLMLLPLLAALIQQTRAASLKLATWNVLAPQYAKSYKYPWCAPQHLDWSHREALVASQIIDLNPDILCLQEVQVDISSALFQRLESYDAVIQNVTEGHNVAIAILVRKDYPFYVERVESRSRVLLAVLRSKNEPRANFYVASVHLEAGTKDGNDLQRYHQLKSLFKRLSHHCSMDGMGLSDASIILAGDFNMLRTNNIYDCLVKGELYHPENNNIKPIPIVNFSDSIPIPMTFARGYALDYIFTSTGISLKSYLPLSPHATVCIPQRWPSKEHPSDHLPIGVELTV